MRQKKKKGTTVVSSVEDKVAEKLVEKVEAAGVEVNPTNESKDQSQYTYYSEATVEDIPKDAATASSNIESEVRDINIGMELEKEEEEKEKFTESASKIKNTT